MIPPRNNRRLAVILLVGLSLHLVAAALHAPHLGTARLVPGPVVGLDAVEVVAGMASPPGPRVGGGTELASGQRSVPPRARLETSHAGAAAADHATHDACLLCRVLSGTQVAQPPGSSPELPADQPPLVCIPAAAPRAVPAIAAGTSPRAPPAPIG